MTNEADSSGKGIVVGFWFRLLADFLDVVLLGIVGFAAAFLLKDVFYGLGEQGWWIGLLVTFLYTGFLQTAIGDGQTFAKKILKIQVLKEDGSFMSLAESFFRYSVIAFIAYNGWIGNGLIATFPVFQNSQLFSAIYGLLVVLCLCGVVFIVPFHPLKQGLHDLLVNTVVVRKGRFTLEGLDALRNPQKAKRAYVIATVIFLVFAGGLFWFSQKAKTFLPEMDQLMAIKTSIEDSTGFSNVGVQKFWNKSGTETTTSLILSGFLVKSRFDDEQFVNSEAKKSVQLAIANLPGIKNYDVIVVRVRSGFNIGISSLNFTRNLRFSTDGEPIKQ